MCPQATVHMVMYLSTRALRLACTWVMYLSTCTRALRLACTSVMYLSLIFLVQFFCQYLFQSTRIPGSEIDHK